MAGAVLLGSHGHDEKMVGTALECWSAALFLRRADTEEGQPLSKTPLKTKNGSFTEWTTKDDLLRIKMDPSEREIQSLLVQMRIFSCIGWRAIEQHFLPSIYKLIAKGELGLSSLSQIQILDMTWALCNIGLHSERPQEENLVSSLLDIVSAFIISLENLQKENPVLNSEVVNKLAGMVFLMVDPPYFTGASSTLQEPLTWSKAILCDQLFRVLSSHPQLISEEVRQHLVQLVGRDGSRDSSGRNLLLLACIKLDSDTLCTIRFISHFGADLNSRYGPGFGALHILAMKENGELRDATSRLLLQLGAHLDLATNSGLTATKAWLVENNQQRQHLPDWLQEGVPNLTCLSSRAIRRNQLPYEEDNVLPADLIPYVSLH